MGTPDKLFNCINNGLVEIKSAQAMINRMLVAASNNPKLSQAEAEIQNTVHIIESILYEKKEAHHTDQKTLKR